MKSAIAIWIFSLLAVCTAVFLAPLSHTVTPVYHDAVQQWLEGKSIYGSGGFHYFPQFVFLFMPFHFLPSPLGDMVWRVASIGLFAWGLWQVLHLLQSAQNKLLFLSATLIVLAPGFDAMRNGQANVIFAALTLHATAGIGRSRWWLAVLCLLGACVAKPIGIVTILLAILIYRALIWRLSLGVVVVVFSPFLFAGPAYVLSQYAEALQHFSVLSHYGANRYADLNGLLRTLGIDFSGSVSPMVRSGAGLLAALLWVFAARRTVEPERVCFLLAVTVTYLMLFNPMTETNSYVIAAPVMALYAVRFLILERRSALGWGLTGMGISIGLFPEMFRRVDPTFGTWWPPLVMLVFSSILVSMVFSSNAVAQK